MKIYVAGPYSPKTTNLHDASRLAYQNTQRAIRVGIDLMKKGHFPYIPHLSHFIHLELDGDLGQEYWYNADLNWLAVCDAIFLMEGWHISKGATLEREFALKNAKAIFYSLDDVKPA